MPGMRAGSIVGLMRLVYTQEIGGSNPSPPIIFFESGSLNSGRMTQIHSFHRSSLRFDHSDPKVDPSKFFFAGPQLTNLPATWIPCYQA